jgi:hypothetical protein
MHGSTEKTLRSLYTCPRGLLRRTRWKLGVRVINFFMVKFPELLGSTSYNAELHISFLTSFQSADILLKACNYKRFQISVTNLLRLSLVIAQIKYFCIQLLWRISPSWNRLNFISWFLFWKWINKAGPLRIP